MSHLQKEQEETLRLKLFCKISTWTLSYQREHSWARVVTLAVDSLPDMYLQSVFGTARERDDGVPENKSLLFEF